MRIDIINGPNLNLLGKREPEVYGNQTFDSFFKDLKNDFKTLDLHYYQSNHEGSLVDHIQGIREVSNGIVINAGAYSHTSVAILDALKLISSPIIEVHISNIYQREKFRKESYISSIAEGCIIGLGLNSYKLAIHHLIRTN